MQQTDQNDLKALDWSAHADQSRWPIGEHLFLAAAAIVVGEAICEPWSGDEPKWSTLVDAPLIPSHDAAFEGGEPIAGVHATWGPIIRSVLSPATFAERELRRDETAWLSSHVPDPDGGPPIPALLLRARRGEDANDPINPLHWETAFLESADRHHLSRAAAKAMPAIARAIAELAFAEEIETFARPIGGGVKMEPLPAELWAVDDPLPRLASCAINMKRPFDVDATPTHRIFVEERGLRAAMPALAQRMQIPLVSDLEGQQWRHVTGLYEKTIDQVAAELERLMADRNTAGWTKQRFAGHAVDMFGSRAGGVAFDRAWRDATISYPEFAKAGRRPVS